jgi:hypothetical protein
MTQTKTNKEIMEKGLSFDYLKTLTGNEIKEITHRLTYKNIKLNGARAEIAQIDTIKDRTYIIRVPKKQDITFKDLGIKELQPCN